VIRGFTLVRASLATRLRRACERPVSSKKGHSLDFRRQTRADPDKVTDYRKLAEPCTVKLLSVHEIHRPKVDQLGGWRENIAQLGLGEAPR